ncbi:formate/nitrite transporter family protein [Rhodococcus rhodnii]|uniref:Formate/nitrite transporter family protein n=1 Tax=Rhodococcus rhodnii TaxID=38312 RepID=A0A6P2CJI8_9NOCA|nr:formate/nitrite transporter family protein [Rhodococcus rhodnii]TXG92523.1 formate/nitrite transporter family protein [Rhodococcus rhodnii]
MYDDTLDDLGDQAESKRGLLRASLPAYLLGAVLAGAYVGIGSIALASVGGPLDRADSPFLIPATGAVFGIALAVVLWAGSELFTGNNLIFTVAALRRRVRWRDTAAIWFWSYLGNLAGSLALAALVVWSGVLSVGGSDEYLASLASDKMNDPVLELFLRGIVCNWLVCLAIWTSLRAKGDAAKLVFVFGLILVFVAAGMEHSVANMSMLTMALFDGAGGDVTWGGFVHNLVPVTLGNVIGGAVFVGGAYVLVARARDTAVTEKN